MNKVFLMGNLGRDPELKYTKEGTAVCTFTLATSYRYKGKDGDKKDKTSWHSCVAWGKTGEVIKEYFTKGKSILVEGRIETDSYEKDGEKKWVTKIVVEGFEFVGSKGESAPEKSPINDKDPDESLPF